MKPPTELQLQKLMHSSTYDPVYAREYYLRNRKLKGRKPGKGDDPTKQGSIVKVPAKKDSEARAKQRAALRQQVKNLEDKLRKLEAKIQDRLREEASEDRKGKAKKERAAKESAKPKTAAEKAAIARENKKYRERNQGKLSNASSSGGSSSSSSKSSTSSSSSSGPRSVSDLQALSTKVAGQLVVAREKLAAL